MARWEPNAPQRLADAALELFTERGYDNTTVLDIAQRAGLAKSSFFRHFQDKREVLFGENVLIEPMATAIAEAPAGASPLEAMARGFDVLGRDVFTSDHRSFAVRRRAVIETHPDLQEREALKGVSLTASMAEAMARRGAPELVADVTAQLGTLALKLTLDRWIDPGNTEEFADIARLIVQDVRTAVATV
ncbi:DNA-binding transcriptional repressor AcrR [Streptomyces sp. YIM 130001]|uniref:TetR/AcrR family transcriptional regulator n=1 Tax=Streptomyces sp. YIM 130001 TaxID=2259644 RepID=UPI000E648B42|nr:TetR/AcrR family transcriptional regulator [Streptomyces sp. YIM 130001]RII17097.1 DNA-binding transcriptional repressor AcrR [Streptomyces sp. YIM 130001]